MINVCKFCGKEFEWGSRQKVYCSDECKSLAISQRSPKEYEKTCEVCDKKFMAKNYRAIYCSPECRRIGRRKKIKINEFKLVCDNCGVEFIRKIKGGTTYGNENSFCCLKCAGEYKNKTGTGIESHCKQCGVLFIKKHNRHFFCSDKCKSMYGSEHVIMKIVACSECGKEIERPRKLGRQNFFCCRECESNFRMREADDVRTCKYCKKEFTCKKHDRLQFCSRACQICGMNKSPTVPHIKAMKIMEVLDVDFCIEKPIKRYSIDIFIDSMNIGIEILGKYWHCDHRIYDGPRYEAQSDGIKKDKKKFEFLKSCNIPILYIWEYDMEIDEDMCRELISRFVNSCGTLDNYHSMNYSFVEGELMLNENISIPYFER